MSDLVETKIVGFLTNMLIYQLGQLAGFDDLDLKLKVPQTLAIPIFMKKKNLKLAELCLLWCPSSFEPYLEKTGFCLCKNKHTDQLRSYC